MLTEIKTIADVEAFFNELHAEGTAFHPDEAFGDYINNETKLPTYSPEDAHVRNVLMEQCFEVCAKENVDIYDIGEMVSVDDIWETVVLGEENYKTEDDAPVFPNGFTAWYETFFEVTKRILKEQEIDHHTEQQTELEKIQSTGGIGGVWEYARDLTFEFEEANKGELWGGEKDWLEEIEGFLDLKFS